MWPAATWIVVGVVMRRSHVETALARRVGGAPAAEDQQAGRHEGRGRSVLPREVEERLVAVAELALPRPSRTRARPGREEHRLQRLEPRGRRRDREERARAIGRVAVQQVVVHLHHDLAAGRERHAGALGQPVPAPAGRPRGDPVRVVERVGDARAGRLREARFRRSTTSPGPESPRSRRLGRGDLPGGTRNRITWWTTFGWPGSMRTDVTDPSPVCFGSRRKQR